MIVKFILIRKNSRTNYQRNRLESKARDILGMNANKSLSDQNPGAWISDLKKQNVENYVRLRNIYCFTSAYIER